TSSAAAALAADGAGSITLQLLVRPSAGDSGNPPCRWPSGAATAGEGFGRGHRTACSVPARAGAPAPGRPPGCRG
ncbi:hypothetical protein CEJ63_20705, partial [Acinetobacter baumannii]